MGHQTLVEYTVGEAAALTGVTAHTLRYYESEGLLIVPRNGGGQRRYTDREVKVIRFITYLRNTGMQISAIREYIELALAGESTIAARLDILQNHRARVEERLAQEREHLEAITEKIRLYEQLMRTNQL